MQQLEKHLRALYSEYCPYTRGCNQEFGQCQYFEDCPTYQWKETQKDQYRRKQYDQTESIDIEGDQELDCEC